MAPRGRCRHHDLSRCRITRRLGSSLESLRSMRRRVYPFFQHSAEVFTADRPDDPPLDEVRAQLGQAPAAERQAQGRGRLAGHLSESRDLLVGQSRRGPHRARSAEGGQAVPREVAEVGIHGVDMRLEQPGHGRGGETGGMEEEHLRATPLPRLQGLLEPSMDVVEFRRGRLPSTQGRDMARPPCGKAPSILTEQVTRIPIEVL